MSAAASPTPMRILMVCMQFPTGPGESYLTTELAEGLVAAGHEVEVLLLDWRAPPGGETRVFTAPNGVRVVQCSPRVAPGLGGWLKDGGKFVLSGRHVAEAARRRLDLESFDAVIAWMPAVAIAPLVRRLRGVPHRLLFIWDFFPDHHRAIGRIPAGPPYWIARAWEQRLLRRFTAIVCTLPGNADYLRRHFRVAPHQRVLVTPIWSETTPLPPIDRAEVRRRYGLPADRPIAVFGGQLAEGRGFEQMFAAARAAQAEGSPLMFLFVGEGPLAADARARAQASTNIAWLPAMPRDSYLELLGACEVGMAVTAPGVASFSVPTKIVDYLRAGIPVVAALEDGNDFSATLHDYGVGRAIAQGDPDALLRAAVELATDRDLRAMACEAAPRCLSEVFDVRHAVATVQTACAP